MNNIYDDKAFFDAYSRMARSTGGLQAAGEWHQLQPLFPAMEGSRVLDLGCGYGWHCKYAVEQGAAEALGLDLSEKMIAEARARYADPRIRYEVCGIAEYSYPAGYYDLVVSNLALHYLADLDDIYRKVFSTLRPGGVFLFNIEHPVFTAGVREDWVRDTEGRPVCWPVDNYYYPGERTTLFLGQEVKKQHHTLTQILMGLIRCGFVLEAVEEAMPDPSMLDLPGMADEMRRPMMLLVKARKPF